jgi:methyl-accepting chemotaxis protein
VVQVETVCHEISENASRLKALTASMRSGSEEQVKGIAQIAGAISRMAAGFQSIAAHRLAPHDWRCPGKLTRLYSLRSASAGSTRIAPAVGIAIAAAATRIAKTAAVDSDAGSCGETP